MARRSSRRRSKRIPLFSMFFAHSREIAVRSKGPDFANSWDSLIFVFFLNFWAQNGPRRAREGFHRFQGSIPLHLDQVSAQMGPSGPLFFSISQKHILGPNSSKSGLGLEPIGPRVPSHMGSRAHGGRRPTFRRGVGERSPPTATRGVWVGGSPPTEKVSSSYCQLRNPEPWIWR